MLLKINHNIRVFKSRHTLRNYFIRLSPYYPITSFSFLEKGVTPIKRK